MYCLRAPGNDTLMARNHPAGGAPVRTNARAHAETVAHSRQFEWLARAGLVARGLVYGVVAILAIKLAVGAGGKAADRPSALYALRDSAGGVPLLVGMALGFGAYAAWRIAQALFDRGDEGDDASGLGKRASQLGKAVLYGGLAVATVRILVGGDSGRSAKQTTAGVFDWPAGRWLVAGAGVAFLLAAAWNAYRGLTLKFMDDIDTGGTKARWIEQIGRIGLLARMVVFGIVGWFLLRAAVQYDPREAVGIGGALSKLAHAEYGRWLLGATAAGLLTFGAFCIAQARYRQV